MDKGYAMNVPAPPYPGPPVQYHPVGQQPAMYPPPQGVHPGGQQPAMYPQPQGAHPAMYPQPQGVHPGGQPAMYPPPPGGPAYAPVPTTSVVVQSMAPVYTTTVVASVLQDVPGQTMCPHCQQSVITHTEHTAGLMAWLIFGGLCLVGCGLCSCIPFCLDSCQDVVHHCPNCRRVLYVYKRMR